MKKFIKEIIFFSAFILLSIFIGNCGTDDSVNATVDFVSGTITFNDSNLNYNGGYYAVSVYSDHTDPFRQTPFKSDSLLISTTGGVTSAYYKVTGLNGDYYIGATWIRHSDNHVSVLGSYGCDTTINCTSSTKVTVPNYAGTGSLNFKSSTDINRNIFP